MESFSSVYKRRGVGSCKRRFEWTQVRVPDAILPKTAVGSFLNKFIEKFVKEKPDKKEEEKKV